MSLSLLSVPASQQLLLKLQSTAAMLLFGLVVGLLFRRILRGLAGDGFIEASPSRRSP